MKLQKLSEHIYIAVEEIHGLELEDLDRIFMEEYLLQADRQTDSRQQAKMRHLIKDIVGIVFFTILTRDDERTESADFAIAE